MGTLSVSLVSDPQEVERLAGGWLAEHVIDANVPATILASELSGERHYEDQSWALVSDADRLVGLAVQTPPFYAVVPSIGAPAAEAVAQAWHDVGRSLPGVLGTEECARAFALCWAELGGVRAEVTMREGLHVLNRLRPPVGVPGRGRSADEGDLDLLVSWLLAFLAEAMPDTPDPVDRDAEREHVRRGLYVLWEDDGEPVSLAGIKPPVAGVGRVGPVYTPPERRGRGYAAAVTTLATERLLDSGGRAMLYTDLANPTSNRVYTRLGYQQVGHLVRWTFG